MTKAFTVEQLRLYQELELPENLIEAAKDPKERALVSVLGKCFARATEATQINLSDIDYKKEELEQLNKERVEIGEKPIKGCTYNSFAKYWHWFAMLGLIERTGTQEPAMYNFLRERVLYRLTAKGRLEIRGWEDPISVAHPELR